MSSNESALCAELKSYCDNEGLPYVCADELLMRDNLTKEQVAWLSQYVIRWDEFMDSEAAHAIEVKTALELAGMYVTVLRESVSREAFGACMTARLDADDVCDSNIVMANAFRRLHQRATWLPSDHEQGRCTAGEVQGDLEVWNAAVEIFRSQCGRVR